MSGQNGHGQRLTISVDDILAVRLAEYINAGYETRDALVKALADVAQQLGIPSIELSEEQFLGIAAEIDRRKQMHAQAKDEGSTTIGPGMTAKVVKDDEYHEELAKRGITST